MIQSKSRLKSIPTARIVSTEVTRVMRDDSYSVPLELVRREFETIVSGMGLVDAKSYMNISSDDDEVSVAFIFESKRTSIDIDDSGEELIISIKRGTNEQGR